MKKETFAKGMILLQKIYGKLDHDLYKIYWDQLKQTEDRTFELAVKKIIDSYEFNFFPKIAVFKKNIGEDYKTRAHNAVLRVKYATTHVGQYESIDFQDRQLHAVIQQYGGWPDICMWHDDEWKYQEKYFRKKSYF